MLVLGGGVKTGRRITIWSHLTRTGAPFSLDSKNRFFFLREKEMGFDRSLRDHLTPPHPSFAPQMPPSPPEGGRFYQARLGSRAPQSQVPRCHGGRAGSSRPTDGAVPCRPSHHTQMLPVENPVENVQTFVRRETGPENGTGKIYKFVISCGPDLL